MTPEPSESVEVARGSTLPVAASDSQGVRSQADSSAAAKSEPAPKSDLDLVGTTIDKYEILARLAVGGMGALFKARHTLLDEVFALKVIRPVLANEPEARERFLREAKAALQFVHQYAVPVRDFGQTKDGLLYMTQDFSHGQSLYLVLRNERRLAPIRALSIVRMCLLALAEAHKRGIVHRDLKPENILVEKDANTGEEVARICDFGLAKLSDAGSGSLTGPYAIGTPLYMSPEQAQGAPVDARSDLYAMGCILYELVTGFTVFSGESPSSILMKHLTQEPEPPSKKASAVTPRLEALVLKALAKKPEERPQTASEFIELIDALGNASKPDTRSLNAEMLRLQEALGAEPRTPNALPRPEPRTSQTKVDGPSPDARVATPNSPTAAVPLPGPSTEIVLTASGKAQPPVTDLAPGRLMRLRTRLEPSTEQGPVRGSVNSVAFSPGGRLVLGAYDDARLRLYEIDGREVRTFSGHEGRALCVAFAPDGRTALSGGQDGTLRCWEVGTGREVRSFKAAAGVSALAVSPDGRLVLAGSRDGTLRLWEIPTGREERVFEGHNGVVSSVQLTPDGRYAISGSRDKSLKIWDIGTGAEVRLLEPHGDCVNGVAVSSDGRHVLSGSCDETAKVSEVATGRRVHSFPIGTAVTCTAFSSDGRWCFVASVDGHLRAFDAGTGERLEDVDLAVLGHTLIDLEPSSDGRLLAGATERSVILVFEIGA